MLAHVSTHELPKHLRGRLVLRLAHGEELLPQIALNPNAKPHVLHSHSVADGYTFGEQFAQEENT